MLTKLAIMQMSEAVQIYLPEQGGSAPEHGCLTVQVARIAAAVHVKIAVGTGARAFTHLCEVVVIIDICHQ
jgi:hypothetical protein